MLKFIPTPLLLLSLLTGCLAPAPADVTVTVTGRVTRHGAGIPGIAVTAWPADSATLAGTPPFRAPPSNGDGAFALRLPPGEYYLLARGADFFSFYGRNPVTVPPSGLADLMLGLVPGNEPPPRGAEVFIESGVAGTVSLDGRPQEGAVVYAYTDLTSRLRGMGYALSAPSDAAGRFDLPLPAGTYYLLARMRHDGSMVTGPLRAGDLIGYAAQNPVTVTGGGVTLTSIPLLAVPDKVERMSDTLFGGTAIKGRILDRSGRPVAGARAILYGEPQMLNRPLFVSRPSEADGSFVLSFPAGGTYYLAARQQLGGAPGPGELYGTWDGTPDHSLHVETGAQLNGIDLIVEEMW